MHLVRCAWPGTGLDHSLVQPLQVLGRQAIEPVGTHTRDQVVANRNPVGVVAVVTDRRSRDVLQPVLQPGRDRPSIARGRHAAFVSLLLQLAYPIGHDRLGAGHDVPPVGLSLIGHADSHAAMPVAITAFVDR
jgi:hypothetical protein